MTGIWDDEFDRADRIEAEIRAYIAERPTMPLAKLKESIMRRFKLHVDEKCATALLRGRT
jgi:hypothetical protein